MTRLRTLHDDLLEEFHEAVALGGRAVMPVIDAVHADDRIDRGVGVRGKLALPLRVVGGQPSQSRQMPAGRTASDDNETRVTAEPVSVGSCPCDRGFDVGDLARPAVSRAGRYSIDKHTQPRRTKCAISA